MRLKFSLPLLVGIGLTVSTVSLSGAVVCGCANAPTSDADAHVEGDEMALESRMFIEPARFQSARASEVVPDGMVPILYGYPTLKTMEAAKRGEIILGGCVVSPGQPQFGYPDIRLEQPAEL